MKPNVYLNSAFAFLLGGAATHLVIRHLGKGSPQLIFVVGAVLGVYLAALVHHRNPDAVNSVGVKGRIGLVFAISALALGLGLQATQHTFEYPQIAIPFAVIGSFVFPFLLFDSFWKALSKPM